MRILLISDAMINNNKGGLSQTLYNIFSFVNAADIFCVTSATAYKNNLPSPPFTSRCITYHFQFLPVPKNRLAKYFKKIIEYVNYTFNQYFRHFNTIKTAIQDFNPDVVITCPNGPEGLFMHFKLKPAFANKKCYPYFMDDWMLHSDIAWPGGNINELAKKILDENKDWLMISETLGSILSERYKVKYNRLLEIHNPVDISSMPEILTTKNNDEYTIAYAGSLWQMHFDAFVIMAKAVQKLQTNMKIKLVVYTAKEHWEWRKNQIEPRGVIYGGSIPYEKIHNKLAEADCLLVTSSFSEAWFTHSKGSVQTKLTDYLKAGRLIISCGPSYSANNAFIKKYGCGVCIETDDVNAAAEKLADILYNINSYQDCILKGRALLTEKFSFEKVHQNLKNFVGV